MNVDIKDAGVARKIATVSFDSEEVSKHESKVCQELGKLVNIPGFRKGKAPANVIRKPKAHECAARFLRLCVVRGACVYARPRICACYLAVVVRGTVDCVVASRESHCVLRTMEIKHQQRRS